MEQQWSTHYMPPPMTHLLKYPIDDDVNIEEGLCKPHNDNIFLLSSIAFLQKQLLRKLGDGHEPVKKESALSRNYSDLLIVENGRSCRREKYFIRLPNVEKFDEILRNEACLPPKTLSSAQILPLARKTKSTKLVISNIFRQKSSTTTIIQNPIEKRSYSFFNVFKRGPSKYCTIAASEMSYTNVSSVSRGLDFVPNKYQEPASETGSKFLNPSMYSLSSVSLVRTSLATTTISRNTGASVPSLNTQKRMESLEDLSKYRLRYSSSTCTGKTLSKAEEEILRIIPTQTSIALKKSINEKLRAKIRCNKVQSGDFVRKDDDFLEDPESGIKFKCVPSTSTKSKVKVREQQSKLSVCIEEETESELESYARDCGYPYNCTDDVKAMVSSETIDLIMHELLQHLEEHMK